MGIFKKSTADPLPVSMAGAKLGDRVLVLGCGDPMLIAGIAIKTGLTGRTCALDEDEAKAQHAASVAEREGGLAEPFASSWHALPFEDASFDLVVVRNVLPALTPEGRARCIQQVWRVLRAGGRSVVIDPAQRSGLGALFGRREVNPAYAAAGGAARVLEAERFRAVRALAEGEGLAFVEGAKGRD